MRTDWPRRLEVIRFGLIGCGSHSQWAVLPAMQSARNCRLVAAADIAPANLEAVGDGIAKYADYRDMLAKEKVDAVYVATPCDAHCEPTIAALEAGAHVVCEKPMGMTVAECRRMLDAARKPRRLIAIDFEVRYYPENGQICRWIDEGRIGRVHAIHMDRCWSGHKNFGGLAQRRKRFLDLSGCLDCGIHMLDLARFFAGGGDWRDIQALGAWFGEAVRFPTHIAVQARLTTGTMVTLNASFAYTASIKEGSEFNNMTIVGTRGVIEVQTDRESNTTVRVVSDNGSEIVSAAELSHAAVIPQLLEDFAAAVENGSPPAARMATGEDGLAAQEIVDEANRQACDKGDCCIVGQ